MLDRLEILLLAAQGHAPVEMCIAVVGTNANGRRVMLDGLRGPSETNKRVPPIYVRVPIVRVLGQRALIVFDSSGEVALLREAHAEIRLGLVERRLDRQRPLIRHDRIGDATLACKSDAKPVITFGVVWGE